MKVLIAIILLVVVTVDAAKRNAQCDNVCQGKMTIECCECIGCNQGMRFGKRSMSYDIPFDFENEKVYSNNNFQIEDVLRQIQLELADEPRHPGAKHFL